MEKLAFFLHLPSLRHDGPSAERTQGRELLCHFLPSIIMNIGPDRLEGKTEIFLLVASAYEPPVVRSHLDNSCIAVPVSLWFCFLWALAF